MKVLVIFFALVLALTAHNVSAVTTAGDCMDAVEYDVMQLINEYRLQNGLNALGSSDVLSASSEHFVQDMAAYVYVGHTMHNGVTWSQNQRNHGYTYNTWRGQVVAGGQTTPEAVVQAWKKSPTHNAVLLSPDATRLGVGWTKRDTGYGNYWVVDFGGYRDAGVDRC